MIYMDGSCFFFDIEGEFSGLCHAVREQNAGLPGDKAAKELIAGFARFFGTEPERVRVAESYEALLPLLIGGKKTAVLETDEIGECYRSVFGEHEAFLEPKAADKKIHPAILADFLNENEAEALFFTNPCCPSSLLMLPDEVETLVSSTDAQILVDESHMVGEENSVLKLTEKYGNLTVLKRMRFGGNGVFAVGKNLPEVACGLSASDQAAGTVIFERNSALKTALRKLTDSRDSLYIRIKKLAIKYASVERLYRTKADHVFFKVTDAEEKARQLWEKGISVRSTDGGLCVFAGNKAENEAVLEALESVLS